MKRELKLNIAARGVPKNQGTEVSTSFGSYKVAFGRSDGMSEVKTRYKYDMYNNVLIYNKYAKIFYFKRI